VQKSMSNNPIGDKNIAIKSPKPLSTIVFALG